MRTLLLLTILALAACSVEIPEGGGEGPAIDAYDTPPGTDEQVPDFAGAGSGSDIDIDSGVDGISDRRAGEIAALRACGLSCGPATAHLYRAVD